MNIFKKIYRFFSKNPLFTVSLTLGLIYLLWKKRGSIVGGTKQLLGDMLHLFQNPLADTVVTSKFGARKDPKGGGLQFHNGIDLRAPLDTPVFAPFDGVAYLSIHKDGGKQLVLKHPNGYKTGYAHLNKRVVLEGQEVKKGDLVAYTGNTGGHTTAPHLHFTLTDPTGKKVDPLSVFKIPLKS